MNLFTAIVIDDSELEAIEVELTLSETGLFPKINVFNTVSQAKKWLQKQPLPVDFIFCDIEMDDINGIEARNLLKSYTHFFVFCTNHEHYSLEAFDIHADGYLLKSVGEQRIFELVDRFRERQKKTVLHKIDYFMLDGVFKDTEEAGRKLFKVKIVDISHFKKVGNYVYVYGDVVDVSGGDFQVLGVFDGDIKTFKKKYWNLYNLVQINAGEILNMDWVDYSHLDVFKIKGVDFRVTKTFSHHVRHFMSMYTPNAKK